MGKFYSEEQVQRAKAIDLEYFLQLKGEELKDAESESVWIYRDSYGRHDSVTIRQNKWFDHKNQQGGDPIGFLQEFMSLSFKEAVAELLNGESVAGLDLSQANEKVPQEKKEFLLPPKAENMRKLYAYLTKTRFIDSEIITEFVCAGKIYQESKHGNIVFIGLDEDNIPRSASRERTNSTGGFRGTVSGSETEYGFGHRGTSNKLFVFEAPIDLLSYLTLNKNNWKEDSYIALDSLSPNSMLKFLDTNPNMEEINICFDHDEAGIEATAKFKDLLVEDKGFSDKSVKRLKPVFKDWNEMLKDTKRC